MLLHMPLDWQINSNYNNPEEYLGKIPTYISSLNPIPIWEQIRDNSISGWEPFDEFFGWKLSADNELLLPGLPALAPAAKAIHLGETIYVYPAGWVCIVQLGGAFSLARVL